MAWPFVDLRGGNPLPFEKGWFSNGLTHRSQNKTCKHRKWFKTGNVGNILEPEPETTH